MALEDGNYISELEPVNPPGTDLVSQADDHLRLIKRALSNSFPAFVGSIAEPAAVNITEAQINNTGRRSEPNSWVDSNSFRQLLIKSGAIEWANSFIVGREENPTGGPGMALRVYSPNSFAMVLRLQAPTNAPSVMVYNAGTDESNDFNESTIQSHQFQIRDVPVAGMEEGRFGGLSTVDRNDQKRFAGFRNRPSREITTAGGGTNQADEDGVIYLNRTGTSNFTPQVMEIPGVTVRIYNKGTGAVTMSVDAGLVYSKYTGSGVTTGNVILQVGGYVDLYYQTTTAVTVTGVGFA
jgi:hypothetical protein